MHLYLVRHGQSHVNLSDWTLGNRDEGLTELGHRQAEALANWLPRFLPDIDTLYASTMARARETAARLEEVYQIKITFDDRLREIGNNRFDHTPWPPEELPERFSDYWGSERPFSTTTPDREGGETFMHFRTRVGMFIEELTRRHVGETIIVVCHGGVIETAFDHIFNIGPWRRAEVWAHNTAVTHFEHLAPPPRLESWRLHFHNRVDHLLQLEGEQVAKY
jgi:probable phosphoglycerate mutase